MIETKIGPNIKPKKPKIFSPRIIPKTVFNGWIFSNFFKKVNLKTLSTNPEILKEICEVKMPYGKHAGIVLADLPISYLEWFHRQGMPKGKLGMQLSTIYEIKINGLMDLLTPIRGEVNYEKPKKRVYKF